MRGLAKITLVETRLMLREKVALLFVFGLPLGLLVAFGVQPGARQASRDFSGQSPAAYIAAIGMAVALAILGLQVLPSVLAVYREKGILRRLAVTPVRPATLLVAQVTVNLAAAVVAVGMLLGVGGAAFDTPVPRRAAAFLVTLVLVVAALFALGLLVAALAPSGRAANAIGMLLFFPSLFLAGVWIPREQMSAPLRRISDFTPLGAGLQALRDAWVGHAIQPLHLAIMAGYAVVAGVAAARFFRWE